MKISTKEVEKKLKNIKNTFTNDQLKLEIEKHKKLIEETQLKMKKYEAEDYKAISVEELETITKKSEQMIKEKK